MLSPVVSSCSQLFDSFPNPVLLSDSNQCLQYFNDAAQTLFSTIRQPLALQQTLPACFLPFFSLTPEERSASTLFLNQVSYELTTSTLDDGMVLFFLQQQSNTNIPPQLLFSLVNKMKGITTSLMYVSQLLTPLVESSSEPNPNRYINIFNQSNYRLLRMMHMLSMFQSSFEAGTDSAESEQCDIADVFYKVAEETRPFMQQIEISFTAEGPEGFYTVRGKAVHLERMLYQMLSNAIKSTPAGGSIKLQMKVADGRVYLTVQDTGSGIPKQTLDSIFHRFEEEDAMPLPDAGLGLGLTLVRHIAQRSNGTVALTSKEGEGTRITVTLPLEKPNRTLRSPIVPLESGLSMALVELSDALPDYCFTPWDVK